MKFEHRHQPLLSSRHFRLLRYAAIAILLGHGMVGSFVWVATGDSTRRADSPATGSGTVSVTVHEAGSKTPLSCRAWLDAAGKRFFKPATPSCTPYERDKSFSCDGQFVIESPAGNAIVHIERGKEYIPINKAITVQQGRTTEMTVALRRWINMTKEGWYSADLHVHFINNREDRHTLTSAKLTDDLRILKQLALADDINLLPAFSYWNQWYTDWPHWPEGASSHADAKHLVTLNNEEIERITPADSKPFTSVGAPFFFGLTKPVYVTQHDKTYPCDAALCRIAKQTSPDCVIDTDKALWAENPVGVALGLFDCVQICHNHYHRDKTFRMGWGMIDTDLEEQNRDWGANRMLMHTNSVYYRWLNCGFHLAASGGSAIGVMPVPLGYSRTYAKLDPDSESGFTEANYLKAIRAGRTFATTGPILILTVNGQDCGATIDWSSQTGKPLQVRARLQSIQPIESLGLIHNGEVVRELRLADQSVRRGGPVLKRSLEITLKPQRSGWVAARAFFKCPDGSLHQAHTSPVYITVDKKPTAFRKDAEYMIRWIDRILQVSAEPQRYSSDQERSDVQTIFREARHVYEGIAQTATRIWKD